MKKLYLRVALLLIPVLLYCAIFFANDPYGYFKHSNVPESTSTLTGKMLDYRNGQYNAIIIGDSRIVGYDVSELSTATGYQYVNMSYGGCMTEEMVQLLTWCIENQTVPIQKIIVVTSFYNMNQMIQQDRVTSTKKIIENPLTYAFSFENLTAMLKKITTSSDKTDTGNTKAEKTAEEKAANFETHKQSMLKYLNSFSYDQEVIQELAELCTDCQRSGIDVRIVLPPWWEGYYSLLAEHQLLSILDEYKSQLSQHVIVYDFENEDCPINQNYDDFTDYSHFRGESLIRFLKVIEGESSPDCKIWDNRAP